MCSATDGDGGYSVLRGVERGSLKEEQIDLLEFWEDDR